MTREVFEIEARYAKAVLAAPNKVQECGKVSVPWWFQLSSFRRFFFSGWFVGWWFSDVGGVMVLRLNAYISSDVTVFF